MAVDILGKLLLAGVDICSWDADEEEQVEHKGVSATNAEADAAAPIVAAAAVATNDFIFHYRSTLGGMSKWRCGTCMVRTRTRGGR